MSKEKELKNRKKKQRLETMMKSMIAFCVRLVTPVDTSTERERPGKLFMHNSFSSGRLEGVCTVILCWAAAVCVAVLISRLQ